MKKKVILITGASSGIGKACATYLSTRGYKVYAHSRNPSPMDSFSMIPLDVTNEDSIKHVVSTILEKEKRIDVLINNAGFGISGSVEEAPIDDVNHLFDTNFFGVLRMIQHVLPVMRQQHTGIIINISSIGGVLGLPYQGMYSATKFAVEGMTEALRMEVRSFGISVVLVEPGDSKTSFTSNRKKIKGSLENSPYQQTQQTVEAVVEYDEQHGSDPLIIARRIEKIISSSHPRLRYRLGSFSQRFAAMLKGVISDRVVQWLLMKYYKVR